MAEGRNRTLLASVAQQPLDDAILDYMTADEVARQGFGAVSTNRARLVRMVEGAEIAADPVSLTKLTVAP